MSKISAQNKSIINNMLGAFSVKGGSLIISVFLLPLYFRFFMNQEILGIWYTMLSVLNWVVLFDLGLGQGLRNQLPKALIEQDVKLAKEYISTTYILMFVMTITLTIFGLMIIPTVNLNAFFNVEERILSHNDLACCILIVFVGVMLQSVLKIITSILYALQKSALVDALAFTSNIIILLALLVMPSRSIVENLVIMSWIHVFAINMPYVVCSFIIFSTMLKDATPSIKFFSKKYIKDIFNIGVSLFWLQIVFMIVSSANEFLITRFCGAEFVVEYQAYYKIFKTAAMIVSLALTPIWSAVTKAKVEQNYLWIKKIYIIFLICVVLCFVGELFIIPFLQWGMNIWLGKDVIIVNVWYAVIFVLSSTVFVLHNVNTSIGNGLSYFKPQLIWMSFAAVVFIPLSYFCVKLFGSWIGVVFASVIAMLPYEVVAPIYAFRKIKKYTGISN